MLGGLYFSGEVDFGTFGQAQFAFSMVLSSVSPDRLTYPGGVVAAQQEHRRVGLSELFE